MTCLAHDGLVCQNAKQSDGNCDQDYRVRFLCPVGTIQDTTGISCISYCETEGLDRDNPGGYCDCETIRDFSPSQICPNPIGIKCREKSTCRTGLSGCRTGDDLQCMDCMEEHVGTVETPQTPARTMRSNSYAQAHVDQLNGLECFHDSNMLLLSVRCRPSIP